MSTQGLNAIADLRISRAFHEQPLLCLGRRMMYPRFLGWLKESSPGCHKLRCLLFVNFIIVISTTDLYASDGILVLPVTKFKYILTYFHILLFRLLLFYKVQAYCDIFHFSSIKFKHV